MKKLIAISMLVLSLCAVRGAPHDFVKGVDFSAYTGISPTLLNNLVDNATVATNRGMVIVQAATPDVATTAKFTNYLWLDINTAPPTIKAYNPAVTNWVSATIGANSVSSSHIIDGTIVTADLAANAIATANVNDNAITEPKIAANAVIESKLATSAVTTAKILDDTILLIDLASDSVNSAKIVDASIVAADLGASAVETAKIATNAVTSVKILDGTIVAVDLGAASVELAKLDHSAGSSNQVLTATGSAVTWSTPLFSKQYVETDASSLPTVADEDRIFTHGLGGC